MGLNDEAEKVRQAVEWVARRVVFTLVVNEIGESWDQWPEIGEDDWLAVQRRAEQICADLDPNSDQFGAAYEFLERRADHD